MRKAYAAKLEAGDLKPDAAQAAVAERLARLAEELGSLRPKGLLNGLLRKPAPPPRGLYIWGPVGRGKTALMDLFFGSAPAAKKRRVHFHAFMQEVHASLHAIRKTHSADGAIGQVAKTIAADALLLCLDEMQVSDIADAMILGRLFDALWKEGVVIVTTANIPPDGLYKDGLNRQLFLPAIAAMQQRFEVIELKSETDYRLGRIKGYETFVTPLGPRADLLTQTLWERLTETPKGMSTELEVLGRKLRVPEAARGCARFDFADLCVAPLGPADFLAIATAFAVVFIRGIPALDATRRNEAKRFVLLIDALYDAKVHLVASSACKPAEIYPAGDHSFEFARTASRLEEMQSAAWWGGRIIET